jgi:hypothetical protein
MLTARTGLSDLISFRHASALGMPYPDANFAHHPSACTSCWARLRRDVPQPGAQPGRGPDLRDPGRLRTALTFALVENYSQQEPGSGSGDVTSSTPLAVDDNGLQQAVSGLPFEPETRLKKQFLVF